MPNDDVVQMQTSDGKIWPVLKSRVPEAMQRGAKPYTAPAAAAPPSAFNRVITSLGGVPSGTNIDPTSKGFYSGTGELGNWIDALKKAITGLNPAPASAD